MRDNRNRPGYDCNGHYTGIDPFASREVTYQVTLDGTLDSEHPNGHLADLEAGKLFKSRRASGKVVTIQRSDGKVPYAR